jgi:hypothetical protein
MMTMYALEQRGRVYVAAFALGCALSSIYGFLSGAWPFGIARPSGPSLPSVATRPRLTTRDNEPRSRNP